MAVAFVNSANSTASGASLTITMPASIVAGNLLMIFISAGANEAGRTVTGWTQLFLKNNTATFSAHAKVAVGSDTATMTGGSNTTHVAVTAQISGTGITSGNLTATFPQSANGVFNSTTCPSLTPTAGSQAYLWLAVAGSAGGAFTASPSGFSAIVNQGTNPAAAFSFLAQTVATKSPGSFTGGGSNQQTATIAIPPPPVVALPNANLFVSQAMARSAYR